MNIKTAREAIQLLATNGMLTDENLRDIMAPVFVRNQSPNGLKAGRPTLYPDANTWDWSKPDIEICRDRGLELNCVRMIRRRLGISAVAAPRNIDKLKQDRANWDWSKSDSKLGSENGLSRERVRQIRASFSLPSSLDARNNLRKEAFVQWVNNRKEISHLEAKNAGFSDVSVRKWCSELGVKRIVKVTYKKARQWAVMNFDLSNTTLAAIWKKHPHSIGTYRCNLGIGPAKYDRRTKVRELESVIMEEKEKAKKFFKA